MTSMVAVVDGVELYNFRGHLYGLPEVRLDWADARDDAAARVYDPGTGVMTGYLGTVTSAAENDLILQTFMARAMASGGGFGPWLGGSDSAVEGEWRWVTGPEAGTLFWLGGIGGTGIGYSDWNAGEPSNSGNNEDCLHYLDYTGGPLGVQWNDLGPEIGYSYILEFGTAGYIDGTAGDDTRDGTGSDDFIQTRAGNDTLNGMAGNDTLVGGAGADSLSGGGGIDIASYETSGIGVTASLADPSANTGNAAGDSYVGIEGLTGSDFADNLTAAETGSWLMGLDGDDSLTGGAGADTLDAGRGHDLLSGGGGDDALDGRGGGDVLQGGEGRDRLNGENGSDQLSGDRGRDTLRGGGGKDLLSGGDGDDKLVGCTGDDTLQGDGGADSFVFGVVCGADTCTDFATGVDILKLDADLTGGVTDADQVVADYASVVGGDVVFDFGGGNTVTLAGVTSTAGLAGDILFV